MKSSGRLTVLVIGGYGTFGGRLCDLLADEPRLRLIVAGRSLQAAQAFCSHPSKAEVVPARFDRDGDVVAGIAELAPDIVVDASGPFQAYGDRNRYRVVDAAIAASADYIDLADAADFVRGIASRDEAARAAGRFVLSGASSFPALTAAVVRELARGLDRVETVCAGIAPTPYAGIGTNVVRAIMSYAGKEVRLVRGGKATSAIGLVDSVTRTIALPGRRPLARTRFSLVDVPDLGLLPDLWPGLREVWVGAGPKPAILHRILSVMALLVHWRVLPSLAFLTPLAGFAASRLRWGAHRGGMFVDVGGRSGDRVIERRWRMIAEGDAGPLVPSMAAEILIRACLDGRRPEPGARPALGDVSLAEYEERFAKRGIAATILPDLDEG